jgi:plasmid maintenance system antidote protein VapI
LEAAKLERCDSTLDRWERLKRDAERCRGQSPQARLQLPAPLHGWGCGGVEDRLVSARRVLTECGYNSSKLPADGGGAPSDGESPRSAPIEDWSKPTSAESAPTATAKKGLPEVEQFVAGRVDELDALIRGLQKIDQSKLTLTVAAGSEASASERDQFNEMLVSLRENISSLKGELTDDAAQRGFCMPLDRPWASDAGPGEARASAAMAQACLSVATLMQLQETFSRLGGYALESTLSESAELGQPLADAIRADAISFERDLDRVSKTLPTLYELLPKFHCPLTRPFAELERLWNDAPDELRQSGLPLFSAGGGTEALSDAGAGVRDFLDKAGVQFEDAPGGLAAVWRAFVATTTGAPAATADLALNRAGMDALAQAADACVKLSVSSEGGPLALRIEAGGARAELPDQALAREFQRLDAALGRLSNLAANQVGYRIRHRSGADTPAAPPSGPGPAPSQALDLVAVRDRLAARGPVLTAAPLLRSVGTRRAGVADLRAALVALGQELPAAADGQANLYDQALMDAVEAFQVTQAGLGVDGVVGSGTLNAMLAALDARIGTQASPALGAATSTQVAPPADLGPDDAGRAFQAAVATLGKSLDAVRRKLDESGTDIGKVGSLAVPVVEMASATHALERIRVRTALDADSATPIAEQRSEEQRQKAAEAELRDATRRLQRVKEQIKGAVALQERADSDALVIYLISQVIGSGNRANDSAETIWSEYQSLGRFQSVLTPFAIVRGQGGRFTCELRDGWWQRFWCQAMGFGFDAKHLGSMPRANLDLMVVFVLGAIGSFIYITQYQVKHILQGRGMSGGGATRYFAWYVFRPVFGIAIAFAIYLLYKTGAAALGSGTDSILTAEVNLPMLALISLFAGLLSWQALGVIQSRGESWMNAQKRKPLYATGLEAGLRNTGQSAAALAAQIGRTPTQIERWIAGRDMVTPEMQDRISTWLDLSRTSLFGEEPLDTAAQGQMRWATGLARALDNGDRVMDSDALAALLERDRDTVRAWIDLRRQVDPEAQLAIAEILDMPPAELFDETRPEAEWWAHNLRNALENDKVPLATAEEVATAVGDSTARVRRWMELIEPVPKPMRDALCTKLGLPHAQLFGTHPPRADDFRWAAKLRSSMQASSLSRAQDLAAAIDADVGLVRAWMEMEICEGQTRPPYCGQVPPATQARIARVLGVPKEAIFRTERAADDFRWAVEPDFRLRVEERGGVNAFAERIDADPGRVQRWIDGEEPIAADTRQRIKQEFALAADDDSLFERRPLQREPKRLEGQWWARQLSDRLAGADDERPLALLPELAQRIGCDADELRAYAELRAPTPPRIRQALVRELNLPHDELFSQQPPALRDFDWAPGLRAQMAQDQLDSTDLALRTDLEPLRIRQWMELDDRTAPWADRLGLAVKLGQVPPSVRRRLVKALDCTERELFDPDQPQQGMRWVVKPTFALAVEQAQGGRAAVLQDMDLDDDRLERWLSWDEPVCEATWQALNRYFGLPLTSNQLFDEQKRAVSAVG